MKKLILLACLAGSLVACGPKPQADVAIDNGPAMKARFTILNNCFNSGNLEAIDTILAMDAIDHAEDTAMHLPKGAAGLKQLVAMWREGQSNFKSEIKTMVAEGDILMVYGTFSATNSGVSMGMPATNKAWSADFADVIRFGPDLKMVEHWGVFDGLKMLKDLGALPPPPGQADTKKSKK